MKLALLIANRGFFPSSVIESAYTDMKEAFSIAGLECLTIDKSMTKYGAVETVQDGFIFAKFLEEHHGEYDGLVICLPNFGDENGIKAAISGCNVPILLQAYPDEPGKMDFDHRRDAFCGKLALTSVLKQMGVKYTTFKPFTVNPLSPEFNQQLEKFAGICRIVKRMKKMRLGAIGARTSAFKSVRFDEVALERHGIDTETYDLSSIFTYMNKFSDSDICVQKWLADLKAAADFSKVPRGRELVLARFAAALSDIIGKSSLDAIAIRCWSELQEKLGIAPCAVMGLLNHSGIPAACEMDVTNAISMLGLALASGKSSGCLDLNNNYGDEENECILFHCGPLPMELMCGPGVIEEHKMLSKSYGQGCSWGLNVGKMNTGKITFSSVRTESGEIRYYVDKGCIIEKPVDKDFFGVYGVLEASDLQDKLQRISEDGFRHHVTITAGDVVDILAESFSKYLGYKRVEL